MKGLLWIGAGVVVFGANAATQDLGKFLEGVVVRTAPASQEPQPAEEEEGEDGEEKKKPSALQKKLAKLTYDRRPSVILKAWSTPPEPEEEQEQAPTGVAQAPDVQVRTDGHGHQPQGEVRDRLQRVQGLFREEVESGLAEDDADEDLAGDAGEPDPAGQRSGKHAGQNDQGQGQEFSRLLQHFVRQRRDQASIPTRSGARWRPW